MEQKIDATSPHGDIRLEYNEMMTNLKTINDKLESEAMQAAMGSIFRSKCDFVREGEKCTKFFLA